MGRFLLIALLTFGVGAAFAQDSEPQPALPPAIHAGSDPLALIAAIYKSYTVDRVNVDDDVFSQRLRALLEADRKATPDGEVGRLDWDVFVNGNDFVLSKVKVALLAKSVTQATVQAHFDNHRQPQAITFDLVREDGAWRIDEVRSTRSGARWTMSKILTGAPDAFPDQTK